MVTIQQIQPRTQVERMMKSRIQDLKKQVRDAQSAFTRELKVVLEPSYYITEEDHPKFSEIKDTSYPTNISQTPEHFSAKSTLEVFVKDGSRLPLPYTKKEADIKDKKERTKENRGNGDGDYYVLAYKKALETLCNSSSNDSSGIPALYQRLRGLQDNLRSAKIDLFKEIEN